MALYFGSDLAHLEVLRVSHAADHVLRLLAERVERLLLLQIGFQRLPCGCHPVVGQLNVAILGF